MSTKNKFKYSGDTNLEMNGIDEIDKNSSAIVS